MTKSAKRRIREREKIQSINESLGWRPGMYRKLSSNSSCAELAEQAQLRADLAKRLESAYERMRANSSPASFGADISKL